MARDPTVHGWTSRSLQRGTSYKGRLIRPSIWTDPSVSVSDPLACASFSFSPVALSTVRAFQQCPANTSCSTATANILATHPQLAATLEGMAPFCPGGCGVVGVAGGGTPAALSAAALRVLEAPLNVFAVVGPGRLRLLPEVLVPEAGQYGHKLDFCFCLFVFSPLSIKRDLTFASSSGQRGSSGRMRVKTGTTSLHGQTSLCAHVHGSFQ